MAVVSRRLLTNFSKGELSPSVEGRPDLAAYFEGGSTIENFYLMRTGGLDRRPGTRFIAEVKDSLRDTTLLPFESDVDTSRVVESGHQYMRFFGGKVRIVDGGGAPVEIVSPYTESQLREIHFTQSVDTGYLFHQDVAQRKLLRVGNDLTWILTQIAFDPPPSFEDDTDVSGGVATLTPAAVSGSGVAFTASAAVFLDADVGRVIIAGAGRAVITAINSPTNTIATANILDDFADTAAIAAGDWKLRLSPQTTIDPNIRTPIGAIVTLVAAIDAFRVEDVGKFIVVYGGLVRIDFFDSAVQVRGALLSEMGGTEDANPAATAAWSLNVPSWSVANGFPRTGEFAQGRLVQAGTLQQLLTFWLSKSADFENYAVGVAADDAIEYAIASRQLNRIEWLADNIDLFIGTSGAELRALSGDGEKPMSGSEVPLVTRQTSEGSAPIQSVQISRRLIFVDRSRRKIFVIAFSIEEDGFDALELTSAADHITESGIRLGPLAFARRPDPRVYFVREDGTLITLTYFHHEKVIGFTRLVTDGTFEAVTVIPQSGGRSDAVYTIVKRTINGHTKRYVEVFEDDAPEVATRKWKSAQTDCTKFYDFNGVSTTTLTDLGHLEEKMVDVIVDGSFRGKFLVRNAQIVLKEPGTQHAEVGLRYDSHLVTMRPAVEGMMTEGMPRTWIKVWARLRNTIGGLVNRKTALFAASPLDTKNLFTGDIEITDDRGPTTDGRLSISQVQPYPMTVLALFGEVQFGDHG